jgi:hypothetical protein
MPTDACPHCGKNANPRKDKTVDADTTPSPKRYKTLPIGADYHPITMDLTINRLLTDQREFLINDLQERLGKRLRELWVEWAKKQEDIRHHADWLTGWDQLDERYKEVDRIMAYDAFLKGYELGVRHGKDLRSRR